MEPKYLLDKDQVQTILLESDNGEVGEVEVILRREDWKYIEAEIV